MLAYRYQQFSVSTYQQAVICQPGRLNYALYSYTKKVEKPLSAVIFIKD